MFVMVSRFSVGRRAKAVCDGRRMSFLGAVVGEKTRSDAKLELELRLTRRVDFDLWEGRSEGEGATSVWLRDAKRALLIGDPYIRRTQHM
jgi:hypothetical protein